MKRVGKRGEGKFERISWDEAIQTIHDKLEHIYGTYGPESVFINYATGMYSATGRNPSKRLLGLLGGFVNQGADYSTHMLQVVMPYMFGSDKKKGSVFSPYDNVNASSFSEAEAHSDLVVLFGNSPAETRMGGANATWDFARVREAVTGRGGKIVNIDYRHERDLCRAMSTNGSPSARVPTPRWRLRSSTSSSSTARLTRRSCASTPSAGTRTPCPSPPRARASPTRPTSWATGEDKTEKTPEWAAQITQIPADKIRELARDLENAQAPFVAQGWGSQRHTNGEQTTRAICMHPDRPRQDRPAGHQHRPARGGAAHLPGQPAPVRRTPSRRRFRSTSL